MWLVGICCVCNYVSCAAIWVVCIYVSCASIQVTSLYTGGMFGQWWWVDVMLMSCEKCGMLVQLW